MAQKVEQVAADQKHIKELQLTDFNVRLQKCGLFGAAALSQTTNQKAGGSIPDCTSLNAKYQVSQ